MELLGHLKYLKCEAKNPRSVHGIPSPRLLATNFPRALPRNQNADFVRQSNIMSGLINLVDLLGQLHA